MKKIIVKELMTAHLTTVEPSATLQEAALLMKKVNCGALPVATEERMEGIITDRDIVIRSLSAGKNPAHEKVSHYMTKDVYACNENDFLEDAVEKMHQHQVSRLVVKDRSGKAVGIISLGSILRNDASIRDLTEAVERAEGKNAGRL